MSQIASVTVLLPILSALFHSSMPVASAQGSAYYVQPFKSAVRRIAPGETICMNPIWNATGKPLAMTGLEEELGRHLKSAKFGAAASGGAEQCAATIYTDLVSLSGQVRLKAQVDFRIVLADEQVPRMSSSVTGKNASTTPVLVSAMSKPVRATLERDAIAAAFAEVVKQIQDAQRDGMKLYTDRSFPD